MTARQYYEAIQYELNKLGKITTPYLDFEAILYFMNKAVLEYCNTIYNTYDTTQTTSDALQVLKSVHVIPFSDFNWEQFQEANIAPLPDDYYHMLTAKIRYSVAQDYKCYRAAEPFYEWTLNKETADLRGHSLNHFFAKPSYEQPYYQIHNNVDALTVGRLPVVNNTAIVRTVSNNVDGAGRDILDGVLDTGGTQIPDLPGSRTTYWYSDDSVKMVYILSDSETVKVVITEKYTAGTATAPTVPDPTTNAANLIVTETIVTDYDTGNILRTTDYRKAYEDIEIEHTDDLVTPANSTPITGSMITNAMIAGQRLGHNGKATIHVRYGRDRTVFQINNVIIEYLKTPSTIVINPEDLERTADFTHQLEFPDVIMMEIVKRAVLIIHENLSDPRMQTNPAINQSVQYAPSGPVQGGGGQ